MGEPGGLPNFDEPPLAEVVLEFQFERIAGWRQAHLGAFWARIRSQYPETVDQPRVSPDVVAWEFGESVRPNRAWFLSPHKDHLIQLQDDRLVTNWRRVDGGDPYPRYGAMLSTFQNAWAEFTTMLEEISLSAPRVEQVELTYINQVSEPASPVVVFDVSPTLPVKATLSESRRAFKYILEPEMGAGSATLSVVLDTVPEGANLILSCQEQVTGTEGAWKALDRARVAIVRTFAGLTTSSMHRIWRER